MVLFLIRIQRRAKAKIRDVLKINNNNNNMYRKVLNEIFFEGLYIMSSHRV